MNELSITLEWFLQEDELKPDVFNKNHKIQINNKFRIWNFVVIVV